MPFITAGDPNLATTGLLLEAVERAGASICEVGIAFSDPIADGPVIQASMTRALAGGVRPAQVFELIASMRSRLELGLVAMVSYSIVHRLGFESFIKDAASVGFDGFIFPDLPLEEADAAREAAAAHGLILSMLVSPTTPPERAERIVRASSGFVYLLARSGITGERDQLPADLPDQITRLRRVTDLPIAVGFGISKPEHVSQVVQLSDAAIVGSAIVRRIGEHRDDEPTRLVSEVERFVGDLVGGLGGR
jgi:tryptophan synthase alpha chain